MTFGKNKGEPKMIELKKKKTCENCEYYYFWDSAYGRCKRFPPQEHLQWSWLKKRIYNITTRYPLVTFDTDICGEFKERKIKND